MARRPAITLLASALALAACTRPDVGDGGGEWWPIAPDQVAEYADAQRAELEERATRSPDDVVRAALIFREPQPPAEAQELIDGAAIEILYYEWRQLGTEMRGGDGWARVGERAAEYRGLRVTYMRGDARVADWSELAADQRVWLVDIGGQQNAFDLAVDAGLIPNPGRPAPTQSDCPGSGIAAKVRC